MKRLFYIFIFGITFYGSSAQSVTILPTDNNEITIKGNVGGATGSILAKYETWTSYRHARLATASNHPLSFGVGDVTQARLNPLGDFGLGNYIALTNWDGNINSSNNLILSRLHVYGLGAKAYAFGSSYPFKSAILGQAYGNATADFNRAGIIGVTDGKATSGSYNIGVLGIGTSDPAASSSTYNFMGGNILSSDVAGYGDYNIVSSSGTGALYGSYKEVSATTATSGSEVFGNFNLVYSTRNSSMYGQFNTVTSGSDATIGASFGSYNYLSSYRNATGIQSVVTKYGGNFIGNNASGITTDVNIDDAYDGFGGDFRVNNSASSYAYAYGVRAVAQNNSERFSTTYGLRANAIGTNNGSKFGVYAIAEGGTGTK
jgi:hypothetical protein